MPKLMLVDDDYQTVNLLRILFEMDGFEVEVAPNGETALSTAVRVNPDAFLVDYHLADYNGTDFVRSVRQQKQFAKSPIIMTSGLDHSDAAMDAGATEFLIKPFEPNHLISRFQELLGMS